MIYSYIPTSSLLFFPVLPYSSPSLSSTLLSSSSSSFHSTILPPSLPPSLLLSFHHSPSLLLSFHHSPSLPPPFIPPFSFPLILTTFLFHSTILPPTLTTFSSLPIHHSLSNSPNFSSSLSQEHTTLMIVQQRE